MRSAPKRKNRAYDGTELTSRHLREVLPAVLRKVEGVFEGNPERILKAWPALIGDKLASMTRAESFVEGVLTVRVKNTTLHSLLHQHEKMRLLTLLRKQFPDVSIKTIVFRIG